MRTATLAASLLLVLLPPGPVVAAPADSNEFLDMDLAQLMNITVTSVAKKEQHLKDAPAAVYVITQEDIRRSGVTTVPEALAMAPGLQVARVSASTWSVASRGFSGFTSNKLLVLMDGRSVYSPAFSSTFWDEQNTLIEDIERIEVIRGPGATMWGANAVNGVINIITRKAQDTHGTLVRFGAGTEERLTAGGRYGGRISDTASGRLYLTYDDHAGNELAGSGADAYDSWQPAQGGFRLDGNPDASREWTLQGDLVRNDGDQLLFPYWQDRPPFLAAVRDQVEVRGGNLLGRFRQEVGAESALTFKAYYDRKDRDERYFRFEFDTFDADLQYETRMGSRNSLTLGTGYRAVRGEFDQKMFQARLPDGTDHLYNGFLQDECTLLADRLWLTLGAKYEHNDFTGSEWQPSAQLLWQPAERHSLWAKTARAVRTPTILEQRGRLVVGVYPGAEGVQAARLLGSERFESEVVNAYEAGYRWRARENLSFDLAVFHNIYDQLYSISPQPGPDGVNFQFGNGMEGDSSGVEVAVDWQAAPWLSLALSYSWLTQDLEVDDPAAIAGMADLLEGTSPAHQASLRSGISLAEHWQLNLWLRYVDAITCLDSTNLVGGAIPIDSYFLFDANLIWTPTKNLELMLAGQNLLEPSRLQYALEVATPPTEIERGVYAKLTWRF
jgi:iron complex outermembrane receptor protein